VVGIGLEYSEFIILDLKRLRLRSELSGEWKEMWKESDEKKERKIKGEKNGKERKLDGREGDH